MMHYQMKRTAWRTTQPKNVWSLWWHEFVPWQTENQNQTNNVVSKVCFCYTWVLALVLALAIAIGTEWWRLLSPLVKQHHMVAGTGASPTSRLVGGGKRHTLQSTQQASAE